MTTLCLDFGNTRLKAAIFTNDMLGEEIMLPDDSIETIGQILEKWKPGKSI